MARRKKQSGAEDFMDLVAMLPWWVGVALAVVFYLVLHQLSAMPKAATLQPGQVADFVTRGLVATFAFYGQFIVPVLCLFGALASFLKRRKREGLVEQATRAAGSDTVNTMSWREFEMLVGEAFRLQGYQVSELGGNGADGGVDLVLRRGSETFLVQCKHWRAFKVSVETVRELYGVMAAQGAAGGFVVTSGTYTADASAWSKGRNIELVDGPQLLYMIRRARASLAPAAATPSGVAPEPAGQPPSCPLCQSTMVRRKARRGANAGSEFWGCSRYPECRGTR